MNRPMKKQETARKTEKVQPVPVAPEAEEIFEFEDQTGRLSLSWWTVAVIIVLAFGIWIRFTDLGRMAYHHDESIHAYYSWHLYKKGPFHRDMQNYPVFYNPVYHGPFLYKAGAAAFLLFGDNDFTGRVPFVLAGIFTLWVAWQFRNVFGKKRAFLLLLLIAISPVMTYFARFARNDVYVGAWNIGLIYCALRYFQAKVVQEKNKYFLGICLFLVLHYCTKENSLAHGLIYCGFLGLFFLFEWGRAYFSSQREIKPLFHKIFRENFQLTYLYIFYGWFSFFMFFFVYFNIPHDWSDPRGPLNATFGPFWKFPIFWIPAFLVLVGIYFAALYLGRWTQPDQEKQEAKEDQQQTRLLQSLYLIVGGLIILGIYTILFTTFGANLNGMSDGIYEYIAYWLKMHHNPRIPGPFWYYLPRLGLYETLGLLTYLIALPVYLVLYFSGKVVLPKDDPKAALFWPWRAFLLVYAPVAVTIYGILQEKVPWLLVHQALPLLLLAATFYGDIWELKNYRWLKRVVAVPVVILMLWSFRGNVLLNVYNNDDPREIMVYTQSDHNCVRIMDEIERIAFESTEGKNMRIVVEGGSQWPFSWYLRNYTNWSITPDRRAVVLVTDKAQELGMQKMLGNRYTVRTYDYRSHWSPDMNRLFREKDKFWERIIRYALYREIWGESGSPKLNFYVKKDLIPIVEPPDIDLPEGAEMRPRPAAYVRSFGRRGAGAGAFIEPRGMVVGPDNLLYVVDSKNGRIQKFSLDGQPVGGWGSPGEGRGAVFNTGWSGPSGIAVGPDGSVYVTDTWAYRIKKFSPDGKFLLQWGEDSGFFGPRDIAVDSSGAVYVADTGNRLIKKFDPNGKQLGQWGGRGAAKGQLDEPVGIAIGPGNDVYVADTGNQRVQIFTSEGQFKQQIYLNGWDTEDTVGVEPFITVDDSGRIYVTDSVKSIVHQFSPDGKRVVTWGSKGQSPGQLSKPSGIAVLPSGDIAVADRDQHRINIFRPLN